MYLNMSRYILTRSVTQIKSHHQKILKKYGTISNIVKRLPRKLENSKKKVIEVPPGKETDLSDIFVLKSEL